MDWRLILEYLVVAGTLTKGDAASISERQKMELGATNDGILEFRRNSEMRHLVAARKGGNSEEE
jgi:hypothetical protein